MLKNISHRFIGSILVLMTGCASYNASTLSILAPVEGRAIKETSVTASWKAFSRNDCKTYLGRDVIAEGYVPIQLTIRNNSNDPMYLSLFNFNVPISSTNEVASKVRTSTGGRIAAWGIPGLFLWPLLIPACIDGFKSASANEDLDADYAAKGLKEQTIQPNSVLNGVVFIPEEFIGQKIELFLVNQRTNQRVMLPEISVAQQ